MSFPFFPVVIEAPPTELALTNSQVPQWYAQMHSPVLIDINLNPSSIDGDNIFWTFFPSNSNGLRNAVSITESPETNSYSLTPDHLSLMISSLTPNEEGNYTIAVLDNLVTSTKTISLSILSKQFVSCVWCSGCCLLLLSSVCFST